MRFGLNRGAGQASRVIPPSRYSVTGYAATTKASRSQGSESSLEQDFMKLLEYDNRVHRFVAQPFTLRWVDEKGHRRRYTPDTIVKFSDWAYRVDPKLRTTIFEVKPREILRKEWSELKPKFRAMTRWARDRGCIFRVVTEDHIRTPYLKNANFLMRFRLNAIGDAPDGGEQQRLLLEALYRLQESTPRELLEAISPNRELQLRLIPWLWNLVTQDLIGVNLMEPLTMASKIWTVESEAQRYFHENHDF